MGSINKVWILGRVGNDPEKKVTQSGSSVVSLSIATSENYKDKQGNKQQKTEWHRVIFWNNLADLVESYVKKGNQLSVEGRLETKEWSDSDGNKKVKTEIIAKEITFISAEPQESQTPTDNKPAYNNGNAKQDKDLIEDDIPF
jgi:single-strand DNA-binding protein